MGVRARSAATGHAAARVRTRQSRSEWPVLVEPVERRVGVAAVYRWKRSGRETAGVTLMVLNSITTRPFITALTIRQQQCLEHREQR